MDLQFSFCFYSHLVTLVLGDIQAAASIDRSTSVPAAVAGTASKVNAKPFLIHLNSYAK